MAACTNCRRDKIRCEGSRPCAACVRKGYECVDRACKNCTQKGKESECTHRKVYDAGSSDFDDEPTSAVSVDHRFVDMTAQASASSAPVEMHHPLLPPMSYTPYNYYYPPPPPHPYPPPHSGPSHPHQPPPYQGGERIVYFPVIDPHLDPPGTSSERRGPDANASGRNE
ncbi:hypothetical protein PILCRDRAFT_181555 [Piloderma croceum F 1598]|uniref:Zn(2)-C6 fungal-type domain-containing protein n=1 Tax=Piloderma croceum (strain F 1598) TaxID=765440 RepID=A0A0C3BUZ9_PILCF|nr:hypothetical protein PILCRDRAFT_181555 [Piloderma croceum F 1598]